PGRPRPRPRAVRAVGELRRAAPLARAEHRHVPRAHRARALDPGGAPLRRALLRSPRRAYRLLRRDARPHAARVPGALRPAATARRRAAAGPARLASIGGGGRARRRPFPGALRRLPPEAGWTATVFTPSGAAPVGALRSRLRERLTVVSAAEGSADEVLAN